MQNLTETAALPSPLLSYDEAGGYLRKSRSFIREAVYAGELPIRRIGRTPYVTREDLDRFIEANREVGEAARRPGRGRGRRPATVAASG